MPPSLDSDNDSVSTSDSASTNDTLGGPTEDEVVIAVMGSTGTGKSSFIKLITGDESIQIGESLESETFEVKDFRFVSHTGRNVRIVDTPGFDDSRPGFSDTDILKAIVNFLLNEYDEKRKLNGLVYLQRITDPRFGGQSTRNLRMFSELCGAETYKNVVVMTTFWDEIGGAKGAAREAQLKSKFFKPLADGGARFMRHDRTIESAISVLDYIHTLVPTNVGIVHEIRVEGKTLEETAAGSVRREEVDQLIAQHKKEVADLQAQMLAVKRSNVKAMRELQKERAEMQERLNRFEVESDQLRKGLEDERESRKAEAATHEARRIQQDRDWESRVRAQAENHEALIEELKAEMERERHAANEERFQDLQRRLTAAEIALAREQDSGPCIIM